MISSSSRDRFASSMVVVGLLGFLRRFPYLSPSITYCFSEQISVARVIPWVSTTVCFSLLPESVVSATKVLLTVISIESTVSGKNTFRPMVVFITFSMGWCIFVSNLGVYRPKVEWRCICRNFIFLLVMEGNRYRRLLKITLGIVEDINNVESTDHFRLALMEETHEGWHYMLSMEVMEEELARVVICFTHMCIILEAVDVKISFYVYGVKCTIGWAYIGATRLFYVIWSSNDRMPKRHTYYIRVRWTLKKEYIMFYNMVASKAYRKEASSISLFHLCPLQHMVHKSAYVKVCFCEVLYELNTIVILFIY